MQLKDIPGFVEKALSKLDIEQGEVLLSTSSDVTIAGEYRRQWLVVTENRLLTFDILDSTAVPLRDMPFAGISDVRTSPQVGCGFLEVRVNEHFVEVIRYSNSEADKFERVRSKLKGFVDGKGLEIEAEDESNPRECPKCGFIRRRAKHPCPRCIKRQRVGRRLLALMWPYRYAAVLLLLLVAAMAGLEFFGPLLLKVLIDGALSAKWEAIPQWLAEFSGQDQLALLNWLVLAMLLLGLGGCLLGTASAVLRAYIAPRITFDLRQRLFEKLERLSVGYHDGQSVGALMSRVTNDTQQLREMVEQITEGFFYQILLLVGSGAIMFAMDAYLTTFVLMTVLPVILGSYLFYRFIHPRWHRVFEERSRQSGFLNSILSGIREVKAFAQEVREKLRFANRSGRLRQSQYAVGKSAAMFFPAMGFIGFLGILVVWFIGGRLVVGDTEGNVWTLGKLMAFVMYLRLFQMPFRRLGRMSHWLTRFMAASQRMFEILDTPEEIDTSRETAKGDPIQGGIEFQNVTFGYSRHEPILHNVSFKIKPREYIGVAGRSGGGKTTIINLICRFYDIDAGNVLIDGKD
ncbi:MAG: ABC transporter ATP-binding protein, partial [Phycisphaerae bacterium]|nr:ABC transporter ATP-binding protein [Phycisphaerae bacterium]